MTDHIDWRLAVVAEVEREVLRAIPCLTVARTDFAFDFTAYWPHNALRT